MDGSGPHPKLLDFGISKILAERDQTRTLTGAGTALGTLPYMSPEQLQDAPSVDARTDIYAAGVMMYEALTGQRPFRASNDGALALAILAHQPLPLRALEPDVPAELERVVLRAMARDPRARHESVSALIDELMPWASSAVRAADAAHRARGVRRQRRALAFAVALLATVCVGAAIMGSGTQHTSTGAYAEAQIRGATAFQAPRMRPSSASAAAPTFAAPPEHGPPVLQPARPTRDGAVRTTRDPALLRPKPSQRPRAGAIRIHQL
jgi:serine/threonine-protein kinase